MVFYGILYYIKIFIQYKNHFKHNNPHKNKTAPAPAHTTIYLKKCVPNHNIIHGNMNNNDNINVITIMILMIIINNNEN